MNSKIFKLLLAYQRLDDALRLKMAAGSSNALEILRLKARKQDLKLRLRSVSSSRHPPPGGLSGRPAALLHPLFTRTTPSVAFAFPCLPLRPAGDAF